MLAMASTLHPRIPAVHANALHGQILYYSRASFWGKVPQKLYICRCVCLRDREYQNIWFIFHHVCCRKINSPRTQHKNLSVEVTHSLTLRLSLIFSPKTKISFVLTVLLSTKLALFLLTNKTSLNFSPKSQPCPRQCQALSQYFRCFY